MWKKFCKYLMKVKIEKYHNMTGTPEVYQTPSSFRVMTWKTETIEGKSFSFKYDTATCSVVIYNMFDACFFNPALYIYPPQTKFGVVYRNHPVCPCTL